MKRIHIAISVTDIEKSVQEYSRRLGVQPDVVIPDEYALWRNEVVNFSVRVDPSSEKLRHLGWEDDDAASFTKETDCNGIVWERFSAKDQKKEIHAIWPEM
ncbi:MAG: hypothetical protein ABW189_00585 [Rickettsiales bacterium]